MPLLTGINRQVFTFIFALLWLSGIANSKLLDLTAIGRVGLKTM